MLREYVPAGGNNPDREEQKFLEMIWEMMVVMDAEKKMIEDYEWAVMSSNESSESSGDSMETEGGEEGGMGQSGLGKRSTNPKEARSNPALLQRLTKEAAKWGLTLTSSDPLFSNEPRCST